MKYSFWGFAFLLASTALGTGTDFGYSFRRADSGNFGCRMTFVQTARRGCAAVTSAACLELVGVTQNGPHRVEISSPAIGEAVARAYINPLFLRSLSAVEPASTYDVAVMVLPRATCAALPALPLCPAGIPHRFSPSIGTSPGTPILASDARGRSCIAGVTPLSDRKSETNANARAWADRVVFDLSQNRQPR